MEKENLQKKILDKIKKSKLKPRHRFFYTAKNFSSWFLFLVFVFLGSISVASILYKITGNFDNIKETIFSELNFSDNNILSIFWTIISIIFIYLSYLNYKNTNFFYRRNLKLVILTVVSFSFLLGTFLFWIGVPKRTEEISQKFLPFYERYSKIQNTKKEIFKRKMREIGITKDILDKNPDLKNKVLDKFDKNVLGKNYLYRIPEKCIFKKLSCEKNQVSFKDSKGCGCRDIHFDLEK